MGKRLQGGKSNTHQQGENSGSQPTELLGFPKKEEQWIA